MDPNLLPPELRSREEKEQAKIKSQPRNFVVQLQQPANEKAKIDLTISDKPKVGFWQSLFAKPAAQPVPAPPAPGIGNLPDVGTELLSGNLATAKPVEKLMPPAKPNLTESQHRIRQGGGWLKNMFNAPAAPISGNTLPASAKNISPGRPVEIREELQPATASITAVAKPSSQLAPSKIQPTVVKSPQRTDSWWAILANLFGFSKRKEEDWRLAQSDKAIRSPVAPLAGLELKKTEPIQPKPLVKIPEPVKTEEKPGSFHLAPKFKKPLGFNVNLIPQELLTEGAGKVGGELLSIALTVVISALVIGIGYGVLFFLERNIEGTLMEKRTELDGLTRQIGDYIVREKENNALADRVSMIKNLLDEKILWSRFFDLLEKYTLDGIYFTNLTADTSGTLILPGVADNYHVLSQELAVLRDAPEFVKDARVTNAQLYSADKVGVLGVSFQLRLVLNDQVFKPVK